jgi:hypothetical protein
MRKRLLEFWLRGTHISEARINQYLKWTSVWSAEQEALFPMSLVCILSAVPAFTFNRPLPDFLTSFFSHTLTLLYLDYSKWIKALTKSSGPLSEAEHLALRTSRTLISDEGNSPYSGCSRMHWAGKRSM